MQSHSSNGVKRCGTEKGKPDSSALQLDYQALPDQCPMDEEPATLLAVPTVSPVPDTAFSEQGRLRNRCTNKTCKKKKRCDDIEKYGECRKTGDGKWVESHKNSMCHCTDYQPEEYSPEREEFRQVKRRLQVLDEGFRTAPDKVRKQVKAKVQEICDIFGMVRKMNMPALPVFKSLEEALAFAQLLPETSKTVIVSDTDVAEQEHDEHVHVHHLKLEGSQGHSDNPINCSAVLIKDSIQLELRSLHLKGIRVAEPALSILDSAKVDLTDCHFTGLGNAVQVSGDAHLRMRGCVIYDCGCSGLVVKNTTGTCTLHDCVLKGNKHAGIAAGGKNITEFNLMISHTILESNDGCSIRLFGGARATWEGKNRLIRDIDYRIEESSGCHLSQILDFPPTPESSDDS